ncbi:MAG: hypothetical protein R3C97_16465 [Geminicoccaceae bacterium]
MRPCAPPSRPGKPILPVYILDEEAAGPWRPAGWLVAAGTGGARRHCRCLRRKGDAAAILDGLIEATGADPGRVDPALQRPFAVEQDKAIEADLRLAASRSRALPGATSSGLSKSRSRAADLQGLRPGLPPVGEGDFRVSPA